MSGCEVCRDHTIKQIFILVLVTVKSNNIVQNELHKALLLVEHLVGASKSLI